MGTSAAGPRRLIELAAPDGPWRALAACRGADPCIFFPVRGDDVGAALEYCARCPVVDDCLEWALSDPYMREAGVAGGTSARARKRIRRASRVRRDPDVYIPLAVPGA